MKLDRELQNKILSECARIYPDDVDFSFIENLYSQYSEDVVDANLFYLQEHGLINECMRKSMDGIWSISDIRASCKGADFIQDDGGLSAILSVVTIKLHSDTLLDLLEMKIHDADIKPEEKNRLVEGLKGLSADGIKHLTMKLLDKGVESMPNLIQLIGTFLQ